MRTFFVGRSGILVRSLLTAVTLVAAGRLATAQRTPLHLVSTAWPPFTNAAGQPRFALDLVEAALGRVGLTSTTTIIDAARFTPALLAGQFDGSAAVWKDADRERVLIFSQPYLENRLILVARQDGDVSATSLTALKGKRIAIVEGYSYGDGVDNAGPTFVRAPSEEDSLRLLLDRRVDYTLMDDLVVQYIADNYGNEARARLRFGVTPLVTRQLYFAVRRALPDAQSIIDRFNAQLQGMVADHTYNRLLHVGWIWTDVDGDGVLELVPQTDRPGPNEPQHAYTLFSTSQPQALPPASVKTETPAPKRFYLGGTIYTDWAAVPDRYKAVGSDRPDPSRSTATIFTFKW